ncbi:discoidin domain-containing protein [Paenibacillus sp. HWE-109]|uniref:discoidin domain-containing protein n=1 Tax=Paenibacillus sp. HWE-109 TaxID=1306526 RepID=UPI001EDD0E8D|nr:discoidin domain-containing protein [Paenibacillus sp. HWE-109]UKS28679.1 discoidin domain-containing protein [Paenibacillus sp. HWE-109]
MPSKKHLIWFGLCFAWLLALLSPSLVYAANPMVVDSYDGALTQNEINSFKAYMQTVEPVVWPNTGSMQGEYAQGASGENIKAMGLMYEMTGDTQILDRMIYFCDVLLSQRNDILAAPYGQRTVWTNTIAPVWPGNNTGTASADSANGDPVGHLAYCAKLILQHPALGSTVVPGGDSYGHGATYAQRAATFVTEADYVVNQFILPKLLNLSNGNKYYFSTQSPYMSGGIMPWNQQMMISYGLQNLAAAHAILGDNPTRVAQYDGIVQTNLNWFFNDNTAKQTYTNSAGKTTYNWGYNPTLLGGEDSNHASLDVAGFYRAYLSGRYGITTAMMMPFANMYADVMMRGPNDFAGRVDGTDGTGHGAPTTYARSGNLFLAALRPDMYYALANADLPNLTSTSMATYSRFMYVKNQRNLGSDTQAPTAPTNLTAAAVSGSQINLSWTAATDNVGVASYAIYRGGTLVGTSATTSYSDMGLTASTTYSYTVKAKDAAANVSAASNTATATTTTSTTSGNLVIGKTYNASTTWNTTYAADKAFDQNTATRWSAANGSLTNQWISVDFGASTAFDQVNLKEISFQRVTSYKLQSSSDGTTFTDIAGTAGTTIGANKTITFGSVNARYLRLYVSAASAVPTIDEMEVYSNAGAADTTAPTTPTGLAASAVSSSQINLSWTASTDNVAVTGYDVYRGAAWVGSTAATSYSDTGLTASTAYSYTVKAKDAAANVSGASSAASATTLGLGNLALGKTYNASTTWSATYPASKAFDVDDVSRWSASSGSVSNQWLSVDFGAATTFNQVVVKEITFQRVTGYKLQSSTDGVTYTDISGTSGTALGASKTINFSPITARYVRLYMTSASAVPTINEVEVYNQ